MSSFLAKIRSIQKLSEDEIKNCTPINASWHIKVRLLLTNIFSIKNPLT